MMVDKIKKSVQRFLNNGYDFAVYDAFRQEIAMQNYRNVRTTSFIGSIIMGCLTVVSLFVASVGKVRPLYLTTAILFLAIYLVTLFFAEKRPRLALVCNYCFLLVAFFFALCLDVIQKNPTATTMCVLLVALPLLLVDKPLRETVFFLVVTLFFMYEAVYLKRSPKASIDVLNGFCFFVVGNFVGYRHSQMVLRNINGHRMLEHERDTDSLTTLYNKSAAEKRAVAYLCSGDVQASMMIIDMDNFKHVNDNYGHHVGDEILAKMGDLLARTFRSSDLISRFGGDEFIVFLPSATSKEVLQQKAQQILQGTELLRISADESYRTHVCIGIASYPQDGTSYEDLFRNADSAMYHMKKHGKNGFAFYSRSTTPKVLVVDDVEMNRVVIVKALEEFITFEAENGKIALEVLAKHPDIAMVITDIHMPVMDGISLIHAIRSNDAYSGIAVIANTQYGDVNQEELALSHGIDDFIYKAASPQVILKRVKNVLAAKADN